jgi:tetratricopeptide (TPR) repeat protein
MPPESAFSRFLNAIKPPPPVNPVALSPEVLALRRRQRRLVTTVLAAGVVAAAGVGVFNYIQSAPQRADKEFREGMKSMRPGKYPDAIVHFNRSLEISPQRGDALLQRGIAHLTVGEPDAALADFQAVNDLNPNLAEAHSGIAMVYVGRHDSRHALEELNKSIALEPTIEAYYQRGEVLESQGEHRKAIDDFDLAIAQARDAPYMYRARAMAKSQLGDLDGARADREAAANLERP